MSTRVRLIIPLLALCLLAALFLIAVVGCAAPTQPPLVQTVVVLQTFVVTATAPPSPTATSTPPPSPTVAPAARKLKIMPLGDSITYGWPDTTYGGYRHLLGTLLTKDGYSFKFVGSQQSGSGVLPDPDNEGHPGWTSSQIKNGIDSNRWLETFQPDLILLHIGTNDFRLGQGASAPANLSSLLDDILTHLPHALIVVAVIIPPRDGPGQAYLSYYAAIPGIVTSKGARVSTVDMKRILTPSDYADILHPNSGGYDKMARAWETAIRAVEPVVAR